MKLIAFYSSYWRRIGLRSAKILFVAVIAFSIINGLANTALLALIGSMLGSSLDQPLKSLALFSTLVLLVPLSRYISEIVILRLVLKVTEDQEINFFQQVLAAPLQVLENLGAPKLVTVFNEDIRYIGDALVSVMMMIMYATMVIGCLAILGWLSPYLLLVSILTLALGVVQNHLFSKIGWKYLVKYREQSDDLHAYYQSLTLGNKELKLNHARREAFLNQLLKPTSSGLCQNRNKANLYFTFSESISQVLFFLMIGLLLFLGTFANLLDFQTMTTGLVIILFMMTPITGIFISIQQLALGDVSAQKIENLGFSLAESIREQEPAALLPKKDWQSLELRDLQFTYHDRETDHPFHVGPINLNFQPGEIVFIQGGNGSGKTTLAKLLAGLYIPDAGRILLDGTPVDDHNRAWFRQHFSAVFLDFVLFEDLLGLEGADLDEKARDYLTRLQIDHKVDVQNGRLTTIQLSQGQRKRLALLTAYLEDRPIYVFDEWASDQDPVFRDIFYEQILPELKRRGKTVLAITHDMRYQHLASRVIKLELGQVESMISTSDLDPLFANFKPKFA